MKNTINKITREKQAGIKTKKAYIILPALLLLLITYSFLIAPRTSPLNEDMQGVVYKMEMKDYKHSPPFIDEIMIQIAKKNLVMTMTSSNRDPNKEKMIFRGDKGKNGEMIIFDEKEKTYYVIDDAFIQEMAERMSGAELKMQEALKNLSKEQLEAIEKARQQGADIDLGGIMKPYTKPEVKKTSDRAMKKGYYCSKYEYHQDGRKIREIWATDWDKIEGGEKAKDAFFAMGDFFISFEESIPGMFRDQNMYEEMNFKDGFPVVVTSFDNHGDLDEETLLELATTRDLNPDIFEPSEEYKRARPDL